MVIAVVTNDNPARFGSGDVAKPLLIKPVPPAETPLSPCLHRF
jgi:hypothetical protein